MSRSAAAVIENKQPLHFQFRKISKSYTDGFNVLSIKKTPRTNPTSILRNPSKKVIQK